MTLSQQLFTQRLALRPYREADRNSFILLNTDPVIRRYMNGPLTVSQASDLFEGLMHQSQANVPAWAVTVSDESVYIGHGFVTAEESADEAEIGYLLFANYWGQGFGTEIAAAVLEQARQRYRRVIATVDLDNPASIRVLQKLNMQCEGEQQDEFGPYLLYSTRGHLAEISTEPGQ